MLWNVWWKLLIIFNHKCLLVCVCVCVRERVREKETIQSDPPLTSKPHFFSPMRFSHYLPLSEIETLVIINVISIKSYSRNNINPMMETYRITSENLVYNKLFNFLLSSFKNRHCSLSYTSERLKYSRQMGLLLKHIHKPLQFLRSCELWKDHHEVMRTFLLKMIISWYMKMLKQTLYRTESDFSPSSFVIAAKACTAYFACLLVPSKQSRSNIRSMELEINNKKMGNTIFNNQVQTEKVLQLYLDETASCSRIVPPALAKMWRIPSLIISLSSLRKLISSSSNPLNNTGLKRARIWKKKCPGEF